jgi:spermidine synthase
MKPWKTLFTATSPDGTPMLLQERDGEFSIRLAGSVLMTSRSHGSEDLLATLALRGLKTRSPRVLVGGMGMGFTARAALDHMGPEGRVVVAELIPPVVEWNRTGPLGPPAGNPLSDPRCSVELGDVQAAIAKAPAAYDAILLDVDNGPNAFTQKANSGLYSKKGLALTRAALRRGGVYALWSASPEEWFIRRLHEAGFVGRMEKAGPRHVVFVATVR